MIIYAVNVHQGGGKVLLGELLKSINKPSVLFSDARFAMQNLPPNIQREIVHPSVFARLASEFKLRKLATRNEAVLCFGNLPPLLPLAAPVSLLFQNTILLSRYSRMPFPFRTRIKHMVERFWLRWGIHRVKVVYVQSEVTREEFLQEFPNTHVVVAPYMVELPVPDESVEKRIDFVYIASAEPHKNHLRLLKAWELLANDGMFPSLALTVGEANKELFRTIVALQNRGLKISNFGTLTHSEVLTLYAKSRAMVFPSLTESFGLPLLEANAAGLPVIASELAYVREFASPVQSFDPNSERSIYKALKRFLTGSNTDVHQEVLSPESFLLLIESQTK